MSYNLPTFNDSTYNGMIVPTINGLVATVEYNGFVLHDLENIALNTLLIESLPSTDIEAVKVPRADGQIQLGYYYRERLIEKTGRVYGKSSDDLEEKLDNLKRAIAEPNKDLIIRRGNRSIKFKARLKNTDSCIRRYDQHYKITYADIDLKFVCFDPFGYDLNYTSQFLEGVTNKKTTIEIENTGVYRTPLILFFNLININNLTKINIKSVNTSEEIEIEDTFINNDILKIDGDNLESLKNGTEIKYIGSFFDLEVGINSVIIEMTATSVDYELTTKFKNNF